MRKKSHVSLAKHIISECTPESEILHTGFFKFGNLVPDLVPSFVTKKHQIDITFDIIEKKVYKVVDTYEASKGLTMLHTKDIGVITHYIADYFTFPHNAQYPGTLKDHMHYEKELITALNSYVTSIDVDVPAAMVDELFLKTCRSPEDIFRYILYVHGAYVRRISRRNFLTEPDGSISTESICEAVRSDCEHIVRVCSNVVAAIMLLLRRKRTFGEVCLSM